ncbi:MAG TPA: dipeptidase [Thermoanaerobaculia bacterium]|nr:dipeptidase [Thermoanaerobaculia bacterium]
MSEASTRASELHRRAIIVDGHCDTPYRLKRQQIHIDEHHTEAQADMRMLKDSGITASFFAAYVPPAYANRGAARFADELIDIIDAECLRRPEVFERANDSAAIRRVKGSGKIGVLIGIEGGHAIEDSLETLRRFYGRGARYLTLTHVNNNNWADSSGETARHGGLTEFGREVVRTMNDLGMIVDISHVSDATFDQVLETTRVPVIASHSSCRALTSHPRNMTDDMLQRLAANGGICMINFFSAFVNEEVAQTLLHSQKRPGRDADGSGPEEVPDDHIDWESYLTWFRQLGCPQASLSQVVDHIMHAVEVAGVDHVGIGSDFDGVPALPEGLTDASFLPALTAELLTRGLAEPKIEKILGLNFLRTFEAIEAGKRS